MPVFLRTGHVDALKLSLDTINLSDRILAVNSLSQICTIQLTYNNCLTLPVIFLELPDAISYRRCRIGGSRCRVRPGLQLISASTFFVQQFVEDAELASIDEQNAFPLFTALVVSLYCLCALKNASTKPLRAVGFWHCQLDTHARPLD